MNNTDILQKIIESSRLIVEFSAILSLVFCIVKEKLLPWLTGFFATNKIGERKKATRLCVIELVGGFIGEFVCVVATFVDIKSLNIWIVFFIYASAVILIVCLYDAYGGNEKKKRHLLMNACLAFAVVATMWLYAYMVCVEKDTMLLYLEILIFIILILLYQLYKNTVIVKEKDLTYVVITRASGKYVSMSKPIEFKDYVMIYPEKKSIHYIKLAKSSIERIECHIKELDERGSEICVEKKELPKERTLQ